MRRMMPLLSAPGARPAGAVLRRPTPVPAIDDTGGGDDEGGGPPVSSPVRMRAPRQYASAPGPEAGMDLAPRVGSAGEGVPIAPAAPQLNPARMANALAANKSATFAAARHAGADYGAAAGAAFVADQGAKADLMTGNFFQNRQVTADANARQNQMNPARVWYLESLGHRNNAEAEYRGAEGRVLVPSLARRNDAAAGRETAQADQITKTTPGTVANLDASADATRAGGRLKDARAQGITSGGDMAKGQLAATQKQLQAAQARIKFLEQRLTVQHRDALGEPPPSQPDAGGPDAVTGGASPAAAPTTRPAAVYNGAGSRPLATPRAAAPSLTPPGIMPGAMTASLPTTGPGNVPLATGGTVYANPQTGQRIRWNGQAWEDVA